MGAKAGALPATHARFRKGHTMLFTEIVSALGLGILAVDVDKGLKPNFQVRSSRSYLEHRFRQRSSPSRGPEVPMAFLSKARARVVSPTLRRRWGQKNFDEIAGLATPNDRLEAEAKLIARNRLISQAKRLARR